MVFRATASGIETIVHDLIAKGFIPPIIVVGIDNGGSTNESKTGR